MILSLRDPISGNVYSRLDKTRDKLGSAAFHIIIADRQQSADSYTGPIPVTVALVAAKIPRGTSIGIDSHLTTEDSI